MSATTLHDPHDTDALLAALGGAAPLGIDTEFMRERTYFAQLCLVQIAVGTDVYFIDPLGNGSLDSEWDALLAHGWVLHSGRQDIEVLYQTMHRMPEGGIFDTQIAAAFAGFAPQIGYAGLVRELFGKELPKSHTRADWSRRPLPEAMLDYAAEDVEYLLDAADQLSERLEKLGRLQWAREDSMALLEPGLYDIDPTDAVSRLRGARNLRGPARRAAVLLAEWRERRALDSNRPRQWILKDAVLLAVAQESPRSETQLASIEGMPAATVRKCGAAILELLQQAMAGSDDYQPPARPGETEKARLKAMQREVAAVARDLDLAPEVITPRKELASLILGDRGVRSLGGWRRELIGDRLLALLD
jgi:ribonuclease D